MQLGRQMCWVYKSLETVHPQTESQLVLYPEQLRVKLYKFQNKEQPGQIVEQMKSGPQFANG